MKKCSKCGIEKSFTEFHKNSASKDGLCNWCKSCKSKNKKEYRKRPDVKRKRAEYMKEYIRKSLGSESYARFLNRSKEYKRKKRAAQSNCIYEIKNNINGKVYIGQTARGVLRWKRHLSYLRGNYHRNSLLQKDFDKYGEGAFEWTILKEFESEDRDVLLAEEAKTIQQYIQDGAELYNLTLTIDQLRMLTENK